MSGVDWEKLEELRAKGASKVSFHASGELASVEFAPSPASVTDDRQHEAPKEPAKRQRAVGGLVPRADSSE